MPTDAPLPARDDTLLGICEGIGEEFGFDPNWLRILLGALMLWNPLATIAGYLMLGAVLMAARLLVPEAIVSADATPVIADDGTGWRLPLAA